MSKIIDAILEGKRLISDIEEWGTEVEYCHIEEAIKRTRTYAHEEHIGLTDADRKEITAFHSSLNIFLHELKMQLTNQDMQRTAEILDMVKGEEHN